MGRNASAVMVAFGMSAFICSVIGASLLDEPFFLIIALPAMMLALYPMIRAHGAVVPIAENDEAHEDARAEDEDEAERIRQIRGRYALTDREVEIMMHIARGLSRNAIGERLYLSSHTVDSHARSLYAKTDCHKKDEIVRLLEEGVGSRKERSASSA